MIKNNVQKIGGFISSIIVPNIGAFIAWGFIAAIFSPSGCFPNEKISQLIEPLTNYLLPLLVGYSGGKITGGARGGIVASIATVGVISGVNMPMILGAILIGPLSGYLIKKLDLKLRDKIPSGFEMLVNNFSLAFMGVILAIIGLVIIGPSMVIINKLMNNGFYFIIKNGLLPLAAIFIEPIKVLFLNNAMNHGIINIIAIDQVKESGKSILYLLEANPGPGLGVIFSYYICSNGVMKQSAPSAAIIQFLGGIHEIYFPYILLNPQLLIALIVGNALSIMIFAFFNTGLISPASPGSIFSIMMLSYKGDILINLVGVFFGAIVSFFISIILLKRKHVDKLDVNIKKDKNELNFDIKNIKKIVFACDVGMGSSAMGARNFINKLKEFKLEIQIINVSISNIPDDADIIITHKGLVGAIKRDIDKSKIIFIENFLEDDNLEKLYEKFKKEYNNNVDSICSSKVSELISEKNILLNLENESREEAIIRAGNLLVNNGYVGYEYIDSMLERENIISTYIGYGIAVPHGTEYGKDQVKKSGVIILQYPEGINFGNQKVYLLIGIASKGDEHLEILSNISQVLGNFEAIENLKSTKNLQDILNIFKL